MQHDKVCGIHSMDLTQICVDKKCKQIGIFMCYKCQQLDHQAHAYISIQELFKFLNGKLGEKVEVSKIHAQQKNCLQQLIKQIKDLLVQVQNEEKELKDDSLYEYLNNFSEKDDQNNAKKLKDLNIENTENLMKDIFKYIDIVKLEIVSKLSPTILAQQETYLKLIENSTRAVQDIIQQFNNKQQIMDVTVENKEIGEFKNRLTILSKHSEPITSLVFSNDSNMIASGAKGQIKLWSAPPNITQINSQQTEGLVTTLAFSNDDKILASGSAKGNIQLWDIKNRNNFILIKQLKQYDDSINRIAFSNNDQFIAFCDDSGKVILWKYQNNENGETILQEEDAIHGLSIYTDSQYIAIITGLGIIKVFGFNSKKTVFIDNSAHQKGGCVQFSKDGMYLASSGKESVIIVWKVQNILEGKIELFKQITLPRQKELLIWTIVFASNSQNLIVLDSISNSIYICSIEKEIPENKIEVTNLNGQRKQQALDISKNMKHIAVGDVKLNLITISQQE